MGYDIASDRSYEVLQTRRLRAQQGLEPQDSTLAPLKVISGYNPRVFVADVEEGTDGADPNPPHIITVPQHTVTLWHRHRKG